MIIRLQADNDFDQRIVTATRLLELALDFQTALAAGLHGRTDPEVLALAAQQGRILVTHDRRTMPQHFEQFITTAMSPGVIIVSRNLSIGQASSWLQLLWVASEAEEYVNAIYSLP
jgi:predicted nuclease of predicted toxin-antitoxin system